MRDKLSSPGTDPRWVDKEKGYPRKANQYPEEIIFAINRARDSRVPAWAITRAIEELTAQHQQVA